MLNRVWAHALTFGAHESDREGLQYIIGLRRIVALRQETGTLIRYPEAFFGHSTRVPPNLVLEDLQSLEIHTFWRRRASEIHILERSHHAVGDDKVPIPLVVCGHDIPGCNVCTGG